MSSGGKRSKLISVGGAGGGGIPNPAPGVLADNEMVKANVGGTAIVGTGDTNTDDEVNFGNKTVVAGTGTYKYRNAHASSSGGETIYFRNLIDGDTFQPCWIKHADGFATARIPDGDLAEFIQEDSKLDIRTNPSWISNPPVDWIVQFLTFEADTTITNVIFKVLKDGEDFYTAKLGTLTANVEKTVDLDILGSDNVPVDAFAGSTYTVSVTSVDGDVRLKGSTANALPFFKVGYYKFIDVELTAQGGLPITESDLAGLVEIGSIGKRFDIVGTGPVRIVRDLEAEITVDQVTTFSDTTTDQIVTTEFSNNNEDLYIKTIRLRAQDEWNNVSITIAGTEDTATFTATLLANVETTIDLPRPVFIGESTLYDLTIDGSAGFGSEPSVTQMTLQGVDAPPFIAFYSYDADTVKAKLLDPDLKMQLRSGVIGVIQFGYQASKAGADPIVQGWTDTSGGGATITPFQDPDDLLDTLRFIDDTATGVAEMERTLAAQDFQNLFDFGGQLNFKVRAIRSSTSTSLVGGIGFSAANDPGWKGGSRGRFLITSFTTGPNNQSITLEGGPTFSFTKGSEYISVALAIHPGTMVADVYIDNVFQQAYDFSGASSNSAWDNRFQFSSGGTSSVNREAYLRESLLTEFTSNNVVLITGPQIETNAMVYLPDNVVRDWVVVFPDENVEFGSTLEGIVPVNGTVTLSRAGNEVTFNGEASLKLEGQGVARVTQLNVDPGAPDKEYQIILSGETKIIPFGSGPDFVPDDFSHFHSEDRKRENHTGTQTHDTISDYDTELAGTANTTAFTPTADYHPATKKYVDDSAGGGLGYVFTTWGANMQTAGRYPTINGAANGPEQSGLGIWAEAIIPDAGTLEAMTYNMGTGNNTTVFKIWVNGIVQHTFTCTGSRDVETGIGVAVSTGDRVAIEYDAGMKPAGSFYTIYIK